MVCAGLKWSILKVKGSVLTNVPRGSEECTDQATMANPGGRSSNTSTTEASFLSLFRTLHSTSISSEVLLTQRITSIFSGPGALMIPGTLPFGGRNVSAGLFGKTILVAAI